VTDRHKMTNLKELDQQLTELQTRFYDTRRQDTNVFVDLTALTARFDTWMTLHAWTWWWRQPREVFALNHRIDAFVKIVSF
jgi:hypothetical protein